MSNIDITVTYAIRRKWNNTWVREGDNVRSYSSIGPAKISASHDRRWMNRKTRRNYGEQPIVYEYVNGLGRPVTKEDYAICKVQMITEPLEEYPWS
jgi:disulfide oxidoreductase YuzD